MTATADQIKELFHRHDADGDGKIDKQEFNNMLRRLGILLAPADERKLFETTDVNHDGGIDVNEFIAAYPTVLALEKRAEAKQMETLLQRTRFSSEEIQAMYANFKKLATAEKDDGVIDKFEFRRMMMDSSLDAHRNAVFYDGLFRMFDRDGSGDIDFTEFVLALALYYGKSTVAESDAKAKMFFSILDVDGDGFISKEDLKKILTDCLASHDVAFGPNDVAKLVDGTFLKFAQLSPAAKFDFAAYKTLAAKKE